ncbi:hypothetical protein JL100_018115 [Skermanella mucosa]|uniref:hypothetical protein n=1 Tax=Skermanella mucosa TaxID=1789672 RepID=UPI00192C038F|nr:hypothetical protein [Skermanella mucosa]UEM19002.1 hypothetical protein JL100_018115 [Skermanella mucosa]
MDDEMNEAAPDQPERADYRTRFQPGQPRPPGAGRPPGVKNKKTQLQEKLFEEQQDEIERLTAEVDGMSVAETLRHLKFNPIVMSVMLAKSPHTSEKVRADVLKDLNAKFAANLKASEHKVTEVKRHEIVFLSPETDAPLSITADVTPLDAEPFIPSLDEPEPVRRRKDD